MIRVYFHYLLLSTLTWLATNVLGASAAAANQLFGLRFTDALLASTVFSAPSVFGLMAGCYHLTDIPSRRKRIIWALLWIAITVLLVVVCFLALAWRTNNLKYALRGYPSTPADFFFLLLPFAVSAPFCFLLIANRLVFPSRIHMPSQNSN